MKLPVSILGSILGSTLGARAVAKKRAARRAREGGAVIFIVAMTLAVLGALGAYALQSASMEIKTAGFERQNTQTHYLAEYGILGAVQSLGQTTASAYVGPMMNTKTQPSTNCTSLPGTSFISLVGISKNCLQLGSTQLQATWVTAVANSTAPLTTWGGTSTTPGSLGITPTNGLFRVELTEPVTVPASPGNTGCNLQVTVSAYGITQYNTTNTTALFASQGTETARARVIVAGANVPCQ